MFHPDFIADYAHPVPTSHEDSVAVWSGISAQASTALDANSVRQPEALKNICRNYALESLQIHSGFITVCSHTQIVNHTQGSRALITKNRVYSKRLFAISEG